MTLVWLVLLGAIPGGPASASESDVETLAAAEHAFAEGVRHRADGSAARQWFARAADAYDVLWRNGHRSPELAVNRSRSRRLAGDLPGAIIALHEGLAVARYSRILQQELADARESVTYPADPEFVAMCRPRPESTIGTRMSPLDAFALAAAGWLVVCAALTRFAMTRAAGWLLAAAGGLAVLLALAVLWWEDARQQRSQVARPVAVVSEATILRRGNSMEWDARLTPPLPIGVEVRERARRGGWVQVELAGGAIGWLPETALRSVE